MCALEGEDDLSDFMIEIDILSECKHVNVVELHEAYFIDGKLWVKKILILTYIVKNFTSKLTQFFVKNKKHVYVKNNTNKYQISVRSNYRFLNTSKLFTT